MADLTKLIPVQEELFQDWYKNWADQLGLNPNPDDPMHFYDYRAAWLNKVEPTKEGNWHWPSLYKTEGHPNLIVDGINTKTGIPVRRE